jgi:hypothetical protein
MKLVASKPEILDLAKEQMPNFLWLLNCEGVEFHLSRWSFVVYRQKPDDTALRYDKHYIVYSEDGNLLSRLEECATDYVLSHATKSGLEPRP